MKFLDTKYFGVKLSPNRIKNDKGQLIVTGCTFARTGKQRYHKSELDLEGEGFIDIDRPASEVSSPATIASFEGAPLTYDHPEDDVKVGVNWDNLSKGMAFNVKYVSVSESDGYLTADLIFTDPNIISDILSDRIKELSAGYNCEVDEATWTQRRIRGNHIAVVESARAGHMAVIRDSAYGKNKKIDIYIDGKYVCSTIQSKTLKEAKENFLKNPTVANKEYKNVDPKKVKAVYDSAMKYSDPEVELQKYLDWEGIYGYTRDLLEKSKEGYDALELFLAEEGIHGYTQTIYNIATGRELAPENIDIEDSKKVTDELVDLTKEVIADFETRLKKLGFKIESTGKTMMGRTHYQIISVRGNQTAETLDTAFDKIMNLSQYMRKTYNAPMTCSMDLQFDGYISAGLDIDKMWVEGTEKKLVDRDSIYLTKAERLLKKSFELYKQNRDPDAEGKRNKKQQSDLDKEFRYLQTEITDALNDGIHNLKLSLDNNETPTMKSFGRLIKLVESYEDLLKEDSSYSERNKKLKYALYRGKTLLKKLEKGIENLKSAKVGDKQVKVVDSYTYNIGKQTYTDYYAYNEEGTKEVVKTVKVKDEIRRKTWKRKI